MQYPTAPALAVLAILYCQAAPCDAEEEVSRPAADALFASAEPMELVLEGPISSVTRDRSEEPEYRPMSLTFAEPSGERRTVQLRVRPRGKSRRDPKVCTFPPLRLNFAKGDLEGTLLEGQDKLKLVTHCRDRGTSFEQNVLKEFLVYETLRLFTDASFRVRLAKVQYVDTEGKRKPITRYGFFIEDKYRLARRLGMSVQEPPKISRHDLEPQHAALVEIFQYFIGNTDFSLVGGPEGEVCCHNVVLVSGADSKYWPIPYDFDSTGAVNPSYALPNEQLPIRNVRQRLYRGFCRDQRLMDAVLEEFEKKRSEIYALLRGQPDLLEKTTRKVLAYFDKYYETANDRQGRRKQLYDRCR